MSDAEIEQSHNVCFISNERKMVFTMTDILENPTSLQRAFQCSAMSTTKDGLHNIAAEGLHDVALVALCCPNGGLERNRILMHGIPRQDIPVPFQV